MPSVSRSTSSRSDHPHHPPSRPAERSLRVVWLPGLRPYIRTWELQREIHAQRCLGRSPDTLLLLEHEPVVTVGRNADGSNLTVPDWLLRDRGIDLAWTDRGGDVTYHGPGQLVGYLIVDLKDLHHDLHRFLREIEEGIIRTAARWGIDARRNPGKTGVWVGGRKLASIGLRASRWVTMHGFALNVATDLEPFDLIVPCGIPGCRMTSMERWTGLTVDLREVGELLTVELAGLWNRHPRIEGERGWQV